LQAQLKTTQADTQTKTNQCLYLFTGATKTTAKQVADKSAGLIMKENL
jgi:hypothetical protein